MLPFNPCKNIQTYQSAHKFNTVVKLLKNKNGARKTRQNSESNAEIIRYGTNAMWCNNHVIHFTFF